MFVQGHDLVVHENNVLRKRRSFQPPPMLACLRQGNVGTQAGLPKFQWQASSSMPLTSALQNKT